MFPAFFTFNYRASKGSEFSKSLASITHCSGKRVDGHQTQFALPHRLAYQRLFVRGKCGAIDLLFVVASLGHLKQVRVVVILSAFFDRAVEQ